MAKHNAKNTRIKREYFQYLREARGYSPASVDAVAKAISRFEESANHRDFASFHREQAVAFKRKLGEQLGEQSGKPLSQSTIGGTLRALREFFLWLAGQPGYKARIRYADADYFNQSDKEQAVARAARAKAPPTLEQMHHVLRVMPTSTPVECRNRAVVALTMLTGARDGALASLRLKHLDLDECVLWQDGREVRTKFAKTFSTWFFPVGGEALSIVTDWVGWLRERHRGDEDALFPATQVGIGEDGCFASRGLTRHGWTTAAPIRGIFKDACAAAETRYFNPHSVRDMLAQLGERMCKTAEEFKVWSQNLGHNSVLTTLTSYGTVAPHRQAEIMRGFGAYRDTRDPLDDPEVRDVLRRIARRAA